MENIIDILYFFVKYSIICHFQNNMTMECCNIFITSCNIFVFSRNGTKKSRTGKNANKWVSCSALFLFSLMI